MSDLISRSKLINDIATYFFSDKCNLDRLGGDLREIINNQPTAYSVDKVVEKLEEIRAKKTCNKEKCDTKEICRICVVDDAIEIVKQVAEEFATDTNVGSNGWIPCRDRLPEDDKKQYIVQKTNGFIDILGFTKDAYKLSRYDFAEYKGKKKQLFYDYDSEYGYTEWECEAWQHLPVPFKGA